MLLMFRARGWAVHEAFGDRWFRSDSGRFQPTRLRTTDRPTRRAEPKTKTPPLAIFREPTLYLHLAAGGATVGTRAAAGGRRTPKRPCGDGRGPSFDRSFLAAAAAASGAEGGERTRCDRQLRHHEHRAGNDARCLDLPPAGRLAVRTGGEPTGLAVPEGVAVTKTPTARVSLGNSGDILVNNACCHP